MSIKLKEDQELNPCPICGQQNDDELKPQFSETVFGALQIRCPKCKIQLKMLDLTSSLETVRDDLVSKWNSMQ